MKHLKTFEQFVFEAEAVKAEDSKVYIDDLSVDGADTIIKAAEILGAIEASATEKEFKDYFFNQYGQTLFSVEDMSKLLKYYNDYKEEKNAEEADKEKEGEENAEDPLGDLGDLGELPTGDEEAQKTGA
jgi:hypothetical protein